MRALPSAALLALAACAPQPAPTWVAADGSGRDPAPALAGCETAARQAQAGAGLAVQGARRGLGQAGPLAGQILGPALAEEARARALGDCMAGQGFAATPATQGTTP